MNDYTKPEYKNLYQEILKDYYWTWGKFNPIPYGFQSNFTKHINTQRGQNAST